MAYPSILSVISNPQPTDRLNSPSHSSIHQAENTAITEIETFVGTLSSVPGTLVYDIRSANSNGGGHVQTANTGGTGYTSYTKGDLLVAQSSSVLTKLAVGNQGQALVVDATAATGVKWGTPNSNPTVRVYAIASILNWTKPSNLSYVKVELVAGGGGPERRGSTPPIGSGGASSGYAMKIISAASLLSVEKIVIGAPGVVASIGGFSSFGTSSYFSALGGGPGGEQAGVGGIGGSVFGGDFQIIGNSGGNANNTEGGNGGDTPMGFGKGGVSSTFGGAGRNAQGYGAGAAAAAVAGNSGGTPTGGIVIVTEY